MGGVIGEPGGAALLNIAYPFVPRWRRITFGFPTYRARRVRPHTIFDLCRGVISAFVSDSCASRRQMRYVLPVGLDPRKKALTEANQSTNLACRIWHVAGYALREG